MKGFWKEFILRGLLCAAGGPLVIAIVYGILGASGVIDYLTPGQVCFGTLTSTLLAFIVAGMTAIYQMEKLPLPIMILLHGGVLYITYIVIYLLNGWLKQALIPILVFTAVFLAGYGVIWCIIYLITKAKTRQLNQALKGN